MSGRRLFVVALAVALAAVLAPAAGSAAVVPSVVINEIQYAPDSGALLPEFKFEYVELYNPTGSGVDLSGFTLLDASGTLATLPAAVLPPGAFLVVYSSAADGVLSEDTDFSDGSGRVVASADWDEEGDLDDSGDAVELYSSVNGIKDFVYYDELNVGDPFADSTAVAAGIWKSGAAIDTLLGSTVGRPIALSIDGAAPHEVSAGANAEDSDWFQYTAAERGTPGSWNDPDVIFKNGFEGTSLTFWTDVVGD